MLPLATVNSIKVNGLIRNVDTMRIWNNNANKFNEAWVRRGEPESTVRDHNQRELNCRTAFVTIIGLESILRISFFSRIITLDHQMDFVPTILIFPMVGKMLRKCGIQSRPKLIKISYEKKKLEWCCPVDAKGRWNAERDQIYTGRTRFMARRNET